ncbi:putative zinc metalloprotease [Suhomyces tanzawaensis NRRL Y-17324]|uniref:Peptide hydrolase n=1 Tax=Suhomyces tanzawaensis NRRL Y-17324 TaxID=984487 RepID=A0A1E4SSH0_9ASCO|nr:putative zinc metalloprotease [Suhomyces tanzawaensis NRRL Y-17324]ODV82454.1 putative zinc metalloprotease [Suhomyces tanzawaensis NRRL Y-17324]
MAEASRDESSSLRSSQSRTNPFVKLVRSTFGYRKTSLTFFILLTFLFTFLTSHYDNDLESSVPLPTNGLEQESLEYAWKALQVIGRYQHPYGSPSNDFVHDSLESSIKEAIASKKYAEYDNDLNYTNNILYRFPAGSNVVHYYESNNLVVRINGTDPSLPALLLSSHYDSVPTSFGITDDGVGVASMLGLLHYYTHHSTKQPLRTIVLNFNNDEEFGLYGASSFLNHPFFKDIAYFLNLEGTGAGGKAFLFRGTDYGIVNHFKKVRYPYGNSIFQQGFDNGLIHSETDFKIYKENGGIRGLDVAFYKPRDIYHTTRDDIRHTGIKSLWHMLSIALDFTEGLQTEIDLDVEAPEESNDFALYFSFFNHFVAFSTSKIVLVNTILLVLVPLISIPFLVVIFQYKHNWNLSFVNVLKFPLSFVLSILALDIFVDVAVVSQNPFIANSSVVLLVFTSLAVFLLVNYVILNGINWVFKSYNVINHDEKLIVNIEISILTWLALIYSTYKLSTNRIGDDHTGELPVTILFVLQSIGSLLGLIGWSFKQGKHDVSKDDESSQPLLDGQRTYGTQEGESNDELDTSIGNDDTSSLSFEHPLPESKFRSYDWSIQFLFIVPLSSLIIYNSGYLILDGLNKSIQESLKAEKLIYLFLQLFVIIWSIPFLPFIFKFNRIIIALLLVFSVTGALLVQNSDAFDINNPLKLRFIQTVDLNSSTQSHVKVLGRIDSPMRAVLNDIPSVKNSGQTVSCSDVGDGLEECSYKSDLAPAFGEKHNFTTDLIDIHVVKNSTANNDYPFGLLSAEIKIHVPKNRMCNLRFNFSESNSIFASLINTDAPVKTFIWYNDKKQGNGTEKHADTLAIPEGFSVDKDGNYVYRLHDGINALNLNKLDWDKDYHLGFQWLPDLVATGSNEFDSELILKLGIQTECFWADLNPLVIDGKAASHVPALEELVHYSPVYVSWANRDRGLVSASKYIEI